jgi:hypothetical protein
MGYISRKTSKKNIDGSKLIVPGQGILTSKNSDNNKNMTKPKNS